MKSFLFLSSFILLVNTASGVEQYPSFGIKFDAKDVEQTQLHIGQLTTHNPTRNDVFLFDANYRASYENYFHLDGGVGYRNFEGNYGVGWNLFYFCTDKPKFYAHQFSPGLEIFLNRFQISVNQYIPLKPSVINKGMKFNFHTISEVGLTYRPSSKYEMGVFPTFNYGTRKFGVKGTATAFVGSNQFGISPSYEKGNFTLSFSLSTHFGGPKTRKRQEIRKTRSFSYDGSEIKKQPKLVPYIVFKQHATPVAPAVFEDVKKEDVISLPTPQEPPKQGWKPFFFKAE